MMDLKWYLIDMRGVVLVAGLLFAWTLPVVMGQKLPASLIADLEERHGVSDGEVRAYARGPGDVEIFILQSTSDMFAGAWATDANGARFYENSAMGDFPAELFMRDPAVARALSRDWVRRYIERIGGMEAAQKDCDSYGSQGYSTVLGAAYFLEAGLKLSPDTTVLDENGRAAGKLSQWQEEVERVLATF